MQSGNSPSPVDDNPPPPAFPKDLVSQDRRFSRAFSVLQSGIKKCAFPGASLAIAHKGRLVAFKGLGHYTYAWLSRRVKAHTIYDLASLTKVIAATAACMRLHEQGKFHLEQPLAEVLP